MDDSEKNLIKEQMKDLREQIENGENKESNIKNIYYIPDVDLMLNKKKDIFLVENEESEYEMYIKGKEGFESISEYDKEKNELKLKKDYVQDILDELKLDQELDVTIKPEELLREDRDIIKEKEDLEQDKEMLEEKQPEEQNEKKEDLKDKEEKPINEKEKMEKDLGMKVTSVFEIQDERFSKNVLGGEKGEASYIVYCPDDNEFKICSKNGDKFEERKEVLGSQGGAVATNTKVNEYNENGDLVEVDSPSFVMVGSDDSEPSMAIDMKYGEINVYMLEKQENGQKFNKEKVVGRSIEPNQEYIEKMKKIEKLKEKGIDCRLNDKGQIVDSKGRDIEKKAIEVEKEKTREDDGGFTPGPDLEERTTGPRYY